MGVQLLPAQAASGLLEPRAEAYRQQVDPSAPLEQPAQVSNGRCVGDLGGPFADLGASAGAGPGVSGGVFEGVASDGRIVSGANAGVGLGLGAETHAGATETWTTTVAGAGCS